MMSGYLQRHKRASRHSYLSDLDQRDSDFGVEFLLKMSRTLRKNQFAGWTYASLKQMTTMGSAVGASHYDVRVHLGFSIL